MNKITISIVAFLFGFAGLAFSQDYELVWEDNFDGDSLNTEYWNVENSVGIWNTGGNQELQHYREENVKVGKDNEGNSALIITAKRENHNGYQFTSGRINSRNKVSAKYGKIEARIKLPELKNGLWPAFWMLGNNNTWPACGEIDIMEAGNAEGIASNTQERTYNGALHWEHAGNHAMYSDNVTTPSNVSLYDYNTFTLVWTPYRINMYLNDSSQPYFSMNITGDDAEEFREWPHFFILNLAVGGAFPGITNPDDITASFPAQMFVDYVRVYQRDGEGELVVEDASENQEHTDFYGVFTERASVTNNFSIDDISGHLYIWNNLQEIEDTPLEGDAVWAFETTADDWFGFGVASEQNGSKIPVDLSYYSDGYLNFAIKVPATNEADLKIMMTDTYGNEVLVWLKNGEEPYGLERNGEWQFISIPVQDFIAGGSVDIQSLHNIFAVAADMGAAGSSFAIDDVFYSLSIPTSARKPDVKPVSTVFPNPAKAGFTVNASASATSVKILDMTGRVLFSQSNLTGVKNLNVNCSGWSPDIYFVMIQLNNGSRDIHKIIAQ